MKSLIDNFINGNLTEAKEQAKKYTRNAIWMYLCKNIGWPAKQAKAAAMYLKNPSQETYNNYCTWDR